jgi:hypothetical protein
MPVKRESWPSQILNSLYTQHRTKYHIYTHSTQIWTDTALRVILSNRENNVKKLNINLTLSLQYYVS